MRPPISSWRPIMKQILRTDLTLRGVLIATSVVAPTAFPAALAGHGTLHYLAFSAILPAAVVLCIGWILLRRSGFHELAVLIRNGAIAGALATIALEVVRYSGFRLGFMPGNLPELMGVLLFDRFALVAMTAPLLPGLPIISGMEPVSGSSSPSDDSGCQLGGRFPTGSPSVSDFW